MDIVKLLPRNFNDGRTEIEIYDDIIVGVFGTLFVAKYDIVFGECKLLRIEDLFENYMWPEKGHGYSCRIVSYIRGLDPEMLEGVEWHHDVPVTIENIEAIEEFETSVVHPFGICKGCHKPKEIVSDGYCQTCHDDLYPF